MPVTVVTDSVASLPVDRAADLGIAIVDLFVNDGTSNLPDREVDLERFYQRLAETKELPTSSQPSVESLVAAFTEAVRRGSGVVGVFISSRMSGTVETARLAARMVREKVPDAMIEIVDSGSNSLQEGFAAIAAAKEALSGQAIERCVDAAVETTKRTRYLFTPASLEYLRKGGRIGTASALVGQLLQIRPILTVEDGQTTTFSKVRTQAKALAEMARTFTNDVGEYGLRQVAVHYIGDRQPADTFATTQVAPVAGVPVAVIPVSAVVGLHVGPAVGLVYETEREFPWR